MMTIIKVVNYKQLVLEQYSEQLTRYAWLLLLFPKWFITFLIIFKFKVVKAEKKSNT